MKIYNRSFEMLNMAHTAALAFIKPERLRKGPSQVNIEITTMCNLNCKACYRRNGNIFAENMSFAEFKEIILSIRPSLICFVGFGEPMLHPEFFRFTEFASERNILVSVTTNGTRISRYASKIIDTGLHTLTVSLDAHDEALYKTIRQNDFYPKIIEGVEKIATSKKTLPILVFHYVIMGDNFLHLAKFIESVARFKPSMVYFQPMEVFSEEDRTSLVKEMTSAALRQSLVKARTAALRNKIFTNLDFWFRDFDHIWSKYRRSDTELMPPRACVRPWISSYISVSGDVIPCCGVSASSRYVVGNIFKDDFESIWNSPKYVRFRKSIKKRVNLHPACRECIPLTLFDKFRNFTERKMVRL